VVVKVHAKTGVGYLGGRRSSRDLVNGMTKL
jgi:hypothetical protein